MSLYFLVVDGALFRQQLRPAFAASWQRRSFGPCTELCVRFAPAAAAFAAQFHVREAGDLLNAVAAGEKFDRALWRQLVSDLLWFSAREIPEMQTAPEELTALLAPGEPEPVALPRDKRPPIWQAHYGTRDLTFGSGCYHPESAGYNEVADVERLSRYLEEIQPAAWRAGDLTGLGLASDQEREEELAFLRDWFPSLQALYCRSAAEKSIVICETIGT
jgi:hypothetical protein